jgi:hypothetical protein
LKNYFKKHTDIFSKIETDTISLHKTRDVNFGMIQANAEGRRIVSTYLGWSRNMLKRWICPLYLLLREDIKHEDMRILFGSTPWFTSIIEELERNHRVWKMVIESIKNWKNDPR